MLSKPKTLIRWAARGESAIRRYGPSIVGHCWESVADCGRGVLQNPSV